MKATGARGVVEDVALVIFLAFMVPLAILLVGTPIALCVRVVVELARRL